MNALVSFWVPRCCSRGAVLNYDPTERAQHVSSSTPCDSLLGAFLTAHREIVLEQILKETREEDPACCMPGL